MSCGTNEKPACPGPSPCIENNVLGTDNRCHQHCGEFKSTCCAATVQGNLNDGCYPNLKCNKDTNVCLRANEVACPSGSNDECFSGNCVFEQGLDGSFVSTCQ